MGWIEGENKNDSIIENGGVIIPDKINCTDTISNPNWKIRD